MSKERLENIKRIIKKVDKLNETGIWTAADDLLVDFHDYGHIKHLIEQAELVQMLENKLSEVCETEFLVGIENEKLKQQNKIYRKALELYAISGQAVGEVKHGEEARKALEESE